MSGQDTKTVLETSEFEQVKECEKVVGMEWRGSGVASLAKKVRIPFPFHSAGVPRIQSARHSRSQTQRSTCERGKFGCRYLRSKKSCKAQSTYRTDREPPNRLTDFSVLRLCSFTRQYLHRHHHVSVNGTKRPMLIYLMCKM